MNRAFALPLGALAVALIPSPLLSQSTPTERVTIRIEAVCDEMPVGSDIRYELTSYTGPQRIEALLPDGTLVRCLSASISTSIETGPVIPTPTPIPTVEPTPTITPTVEPSSTPTPTPTLEPEPTPTSEPTPTVEPTATPISL